MSEASSNIGVNVNPAGAPSGDASKILSSESSDFFSKLVMMIGLVFVVVIVLKIGIQILFYLMSNTSNPNLLPGLVDGSEKRVITQDPSKKKSVTILRSKDEKEGLEFTWSTWLFIKEGDSNFNYTGNYKHVFSKGNDYVLNDDDIVANFDISNGMIWPNASPGLYINDSKNSLRVSINTFETVVEHIDIDNIPLNKWINIMIRVKGLVLDVYINGIIVNRHYLSGVPKQNYGDVYTGLNGGFNGYQSCLRYFNYALEPGKINSIVDSGPCLNRLSSEEDKGIPRYFSTKWYFD